MDNYNAILKYIETDKLELIDPDQIQYLYDIHKVRNQEWRKITKLMNTKQLFYVSGKISEVNSKIEKERKAQLSVDELRLEKIGSRKHYSSLSSGYNYNLNAEYREMIKYLETGNASLSEIRRDRIERTRKSENLFFYSKEEHEFSTKYQSKFIVKDQTFYSVYQYMNYVKADVFYEEDLKVAILNETRINKLFILGQKVRDFEKELYLNYYFGNRLKDACILKFEQNSSLKKKLFETKGQTIVLACDNKYFGIGTDEYHASAINRETWQGKNIMGDLLTDIRCELMGEY